MVQQKANWVSLVFYLVAEYLCPPKVPLLVVILPKRIDSFPVSADDWI